MAASLRALLDRYLGSSIEKINNNHDKLGRFASASGHAAATGTHSSSNPGELIHGAGLAHRGDGTDPEEWPTAAKAKSEAKKWASEGYTAAKIMDGEGNVRHVTARFQPVSEKKIAASSTYVPKGSRPLPPATRTAAAKKAAGSKVSTNAKPAPARGTRKKKTKEEVLKENLKKPDSKIDQDPKSLDVPRPLKPGFHKVNSAHERWKEDARVETSSPIPPNWTHVQVSNNAHGVVGQRGGILVATGMVKVNVKQKNGSMKIVDKEQPLYSTTHNQRSAGAKFDKTAQLARKVKTLDENLSKDAQRNPDAATVMLIRKTGMRVGSDDPKSAEGVVFGASNMRRQHVKVSADGKTVTLDFKAKHGVQQHRVIDDPEMVSVIKSHMAGKKPTDRLFGENPTMVKDARTGQLKPRGGVSDSSTNKYIKASIPGASNKSLRTLYGTTLAHAEVAAMPAPKTAAERTKAIKSVATTVSQHLGNTPKVALDSYISPEVFFPWVI